MTNALSTKNSAKNGGMGNVDKQIRPPHYARLPEFRHIEADLPSQGYSGQVEYGFYSECFFGEVAKVAIDHEGRIDKAHGQMLRLCKNEPWYLQPKYVEVWGSIPRDISPPTPPQMDGKLYGMPDMRMGAWNSSDLQLIVLRGPRAH